MYCLRINPNGAILFPWTIVIFSPFFLCATPLFASPHSERRTAFAFRSSSCSSCNPVCRFRLCLFRRPSSVVRGLFCLPPKKTPSRNRKDADKTATNKKGIAPFQVCNRRAPNGETSTPKSSADQTGAMWQPSQTRGLALLGRKTARPLKRKKRKAPSSPFFLLLFAHLSQTYAIALYKSR